MAMSIYKYILYSLNKALDEEVAEVLSDGLGLTQVRLGIIEKKSRDDISVVIIDEDYIKGEDLSWIEMKDKEIILLANSSSPKNIATGNNQVIRISKEDLQNKLFYCVSRVLLNIEMEHIKRVAHSSQEEKPKELFLRSEDGMYWRVVLDAILFIEAYGNYIKIYEIDGKSAVRNCSIKTIEEYLPENLFCRIHRSYIVRIDRVYNFNANNLEIANRILPIGRKHRTDFEGKLKKI